MSLLKSEGWSGISVQQGILMSDGESTPGPDADAGSPQPTASGAKRPRWRRVVLAVALVLVVLLAGAAIALFSAYNRLDDNLTKRDWTSQIPEEQRPSKRTPRGPEGSGSSEAPINILVLGSDDRGTTAAAARRGSRSDTTILLHLSGDRRRAYGVSIPRDSIVKRPDCVDEDGTTIPGDPAAMWNAAFSYGGPACTLHQTEQTTGVRIDHMVVLNFVGFKNMVDAIGGVEVTVDQPIGTPGTDTYLPAGTHELRGDQALLYVQDRKSFGDGSDIGRIRHQQAFMASIAREVVSAGTLANPVKLFNFLDAATESLEVDTEMGSLREMARLGNQFRDIGLSDIQFSTVPWEAYPADPNRVQWGPDAAELWRLIANDKPVPDWYLDGGISAEQPSTTG